MSNQTNPKNPFSWWVLTISIILTLISGIIYGIIYWAVPQFKELFYEFGSELPFITFFVLNTYIFYGLFFLFGLIPCIKLFQSRNITTGKEIKLSMFVVFNFILAILIQGLVIFSMYMPIFKMEEVL